MTKDGFDVHHLDGNKGNESPDNLVLIEHTDHMMLHGSRMLGRLKGKSIVIELPDEIVGAFRLMEALGTADIYFQNGLISQLANVGS